MSDPDTGKSGAAAAEAGRTARLTLEPLNAAHAAMLFPVLADPGLYTYVPEEARATVALLAECFGELAQGAPPEANEIWLNWVLRRQDEGVAIGTLQATVEQGGRAWIGYLLAPSAWGQGFATEACTWLVAELARRFGVRDILASVDARNAKSIAVIERVGFSPDATCFAESCGEETTGCRYLLCSAA